jgi:hypothetical protein
MPKQNYACEDTNKYAQDFMAHLANVAIFVLYF